MAETIPLAAIAACVLLVIPALEPPFFAPKVLALALGAVAALPALRHRRPPLADFGPLVAVLLSTALGEAWLPWPVLCAASFSVALVSWGATGVEWRSLAAVGALVGAASSVVVLLQQLGLDPLAAFAPQVHGRLAVYGTLGNPDFVASVLGVTSWLAVDWAGRRRWAWAAVLLHVAALAATRSLATVVALAAGLAVLGAATRSLRRVVPGLAAVLVIAVGLSGRDPGTALRGRWYLAKVAAPQLLTAPLVGRGPGAVEVLWPQWEVDWWSARCDDAACVQAHPDAPFAAAQDHLHLDALERWLEQGALGVLALGALVVRALRRRPPLYVAALTTLLVRSCFDFPLARPADLALLAALLVCSRSGTGRHA